MKKMTSYLLLIILLITNLNSSIIAYSGTEKIDNNILKESIKQNENNKYAPGEIIVKFKKSAINLKNIGDVKKVRNIAGTKDTFIKENIENENIILLKTKGKGNIDSIISQLKKDPNVEYAQPNHIHKIYSNGNSITSNDTHKNLLWALENAGQTINGISGEITGTANADINAQSAWNINEGTGGEVIVAIIDTGVAYNHPDLQSNMWDGINCKDENGNFLGGCIHGYDFVDEDNDPKPTDGSHGTHIAGTIGAIKNNNKGIIGVAPNVKIMALKAGGESIGLAEDDIIQSIDFAIQNGAKIINASFGCLSDSCYSQAEFDAINRFKTYGGIFIAAAGNEINDNDEINNYPSNYNLDNIFAVAATDQNDDIAWFSSYGLNTVDIGAPGMNIYSTVAGTTYYGTPENITTENFENLNEPEIPNGWTLSGSGNNWGTKSGNLSADYINVPYVTDADFEIISPTFDLTNNGTGGSVIIDFDTTCDTDYSTTDWLDYMSLYVSHDGSNFMEQTRWDEFELDLLNGEYPENDEGSASYHIQEVLGSNYLINNFQFKFKWHSDSVSTNTGTLGCIIDNFQLSTKKYTDGNDEGYDYQQGTSMATPHVSGLFALLWGYNPSLTYSQIKNLIMKEGDPVNSLNGKTVSGKRINAFRTLESLNPYVEYLGFDQSTNGDGIVNISFYLKDGISGIPLQLSNFQYSTNSGSTWNIPENGDSSLSLSENWENNNYISGESNNPGNIYEFTWNTKHNDISGLSNVKNNNVQIRFNIFDGGKKQGLYESGNFSIDNETINPTITNPIQAVKTNQSQFTITGTAEKNSTINIYDNSDNLVGNQILTNDETNFLITVDLEINSINMFRLLSIDEFGNQNEFVNVNNIIQDSNGVIASLKDINGDNIAPYYIINEKTGHITDVNLVSLYNGVNVNSHISNGDNVIAIIGITANNADTSVKLKQIGLDLNLDSGSSSTGGKINNIKIERISGNGNSSSFTVNSCIDTSETTYTNCNITIDSGVLNALGLSGGIQLNGESGYYKITANISGIDIGGLPNNLNVNVNNLAYTSMLDNETVIYAGNNTQINIIGEEGMQCRWSDTDDSYSDMVNNCTINGSEATCAISTQGSDGEKEIHISCKDDAENEHTGTNNLDINYIFDTNNPIIDLTNVTPNISSGGIVIVELNISDVLSGINYETNPLVIVEGLNTGYTLNQESFTGSTWIGAFNLPYEDEEKTATIKISGLSDNAGNIINDIEVGTFTVDTKAPTAIISGNPTEGSTDTSAIPGANLTISGDQVDYYKYKFNDSEYSDEIESSENLILSNLQNGSHTIYVIAKDSNGNWQSESGATIYNWTVNDLIAPLITDANGGALANDSIPTKTKYWDWTSSDTSAIFRYSIDQSETGAIIGEYGNNTTAVQANGDGTYYLHLQSIDNNGNESDVITISAILDNSGPSVNKLGDGISDYTIQAGSTASLNFDETINSISKNIIQNAIRSGADKSVNFEWNNSDKNLQISAGGNYVVRFNNDVIAKNIKDNLDNTTSEILLIDSAIESNQLITNSGSAIATQEKTEVLVDSFEPITFNVPSNVTNASIDVSILKSSSGEVSTAMLPDLNINVDINILPDPINVVIESGTTVIGPADWDGKIKAPTITTVQVSLPAASEGKTNTFDKVIEIGTSSGSLQFDKAIKIEIPNQATNIDRVGYVANGSNSVTLINYICTGSDQLTITNELQSQNEQECKQGSGSDLIIWTKHFTKFVTYNETNQNSNSSGGNSGNNSRGGGGGGGAGTIPEVGDYIIPIKINNDIKTKDNVNFKNIKDGLAPTNITMEYINGDYGIYIPKGDKITYKNGEIFNGKILAPQRVSNKKIPEIKGNKSVLKSLKIITDDGKFIEFGNDIKLDISLKGISENIDINNLYIYYYDEESKKYKLEDKNKNIDKENKKISIDVNHIGLFILTENKNLTETRNSKSDIKLPFVDIASHWAKDSILKLFSLGVFAIKENFNPDQYIKRTEGIKMTIEAFSLGINNDVKNIKFKDIEKDGWYLPYLSKALEIGIISYDSKNTKFRPGETINRAEGLKMLFKAAGIDPSSLRGGKTDEAIHTSKLNYEDVQKKSWYYDIIDYAVKNGIIKGYENGKIEPTAPMTRAQMVTMIERIKEFKEQSK